MSDQPKAIAPEWREAAEVAMRVTQLARRLAEANATADMPASTLMPAMLEVVGRAHAAARVVGALEDLFNAVEGAAEAIKEIERANLEGLEKELSNIAGVIQSK
jgi:hypothetical protein